MTTILIKYPYRHFHLHYIQTLPFLHVEEDADDESILVFSINNNMF